MRVFRHSRVPETGFERTLSLRKAETLSVKLDEPLGVNLSNGGSTSVHAC